MAIEFNFRKTTTLIITCLLFVACKKEDKPEVEYYGIIGTWESTSFNLKKISKEGVLISDSVLNYLSPINYRYTFNKDSTFEFIANTNNPIKFNRGVGKGIYGIEGRMMFREDGMINMVTSKDGSSEFITVPYYLSKDKFAIVVSAEYADTSFNNEYVLNFNRKK